MLNALRLIVGHAAEVILAGAIIGLALAFAGTRTLPAVLYQVSPHDFSTFGLVTVALGTIALLASYIPAARVMRANPMIALSHNV